MKKYGENIVVTGAGEMAGARQVAAKTSSWRGFCNLFSISRLYKRLECQTYCNGTLVADGPSTDCFFTQKMTILQVMEAHGDLWTSSQARRLLKNKGKG